jgi:hypothetical protein
MQKISSIGMTDQVPTLVRHDFHFWGGFRALMAPVLLFALYLLAFGLIQFRQTGFLDNDSYYHMRMAALIREQGLKVDFTWLPLSTLDREGYTNLHLFHHVYLSLFAGDGSPESLVFGGKVASVLMAALIGVVLWAILRAEKVRWPALWSLGLLAISVTFLVRLSLTRAMSAALVMQLLAVYLLLRRRYFWLMPLGFIYVWWYDAYPMLLAVIFAYLAATLLSERRIAWGALIWSVLGVTLGVVLHPYFPQNIQGTVFEVVRGNMLGIDQGSATATPDPAMVLDRPIVVGDEWARFTGGELIASAGVAVALWLVGMVLALSGRPRHSDQPVTNWRERVVARIPERPLLFAMFLSMGFGLLMLMAQRFIEYFPAYALLLIALASRPVIDRLARQPQRARALAVLMALAILLPVWPSIGLGYYTKGLPDQIVADYIDAAAWMHEHVPSGSRVFLSLWDMFPWLFFYNTDVEYTLGLDPRYSYNYDPELYALYDRMLRGRVEQPGPIIYERFGAQYVLVRAMGWMDVEGQQKRMLPGIIKTAGEDPTMERVYDKGSVVIYKITMP